MKNIVSRQASGDFNVYPEKAILTKYRDAGLIDYIYFWTIKNVQVSPIYSGEEEAQSWNGKIERELT